MKNIAVVGCGYWGKNLIKNFSQLGSLKYVFDFDISLKQKFEQDYGLEECKDFDHLIKDQALDGIVIATPAETHFELAKQVLLSKKDVFVEKPLCLLLKHVNELNEIAQKNNLIIMVGHLLQYHDHFTKLLEIKEKSKGKLIKVTSKRKSFGKIRFNENVIWSFAPHDISMINRICPGELKNFKCIKNSYFDKNIDSAYMSFTKSDVKCEIQVDWSSIEKEHKIELYFSDGIVVFEDSAPFDEKLYIYDISFNQSTLVEKNKIEKRFIKINSRQPLENECKAFLKSIKSRKAPYTNADESIKVLELLLRSDEK